MQKTREKIQENEKIASNTQGPFYRYIQSNLPKYGVKSKLQVHSHLLQSTGL